MPVTNEEIGILEKIFNPQFSALNSGIAALSQKVDESTKNNRESIRELYELNRQQTARTAEVERELRAEFIKALAELRGVQSLQAQQIVVLQAKTQYIKDETSEIKDERAGDEVKREGRRQFTIGQLVTIGTVLLGIAVTIALTLRG